MTTKVVVACPDKSHWPLKVSSQELTIVGYEISDGFVVPNPSARHWITVGAPVVLKPGEVHETHIYTTRRLIIEEGDPIV
ncbi:hypothetical protein ACVWXN_003487 [Bradyrhizobium sp. i1.4.4]